MARGTLRIYLGAAPGVGKTYAMLNEGWRRKERGTDVVVGFIEAHGRINTAAQLRDLEVVPRKAMTYRGADFEEMDVDALLARHPRVALVDELAHTNVPGSRNAKRWQDVEELLDVGIDVISTVNIQHLESLNDVVEQITGIEQRETIPDTVVRAADQVELVDMTPEALRRRMAHGNVYAPERVDTALANYFRTGNLGALRELALMWVADQVDAALERYREQHGIGKPWETRERVVVAITGAPSGDAVVRRAARMARRTRAELLGVHVRAADGLRSPPSEGLLHQRQLLAELDGTYFEVAGDDVADALVRFAWSENATQLVMGESRRTRWNELVRGSVINAVIRRSGPIDIHVISTPDAVAAEAAGAGEPAPPTPRPVRPPRRTRGVSRRRWWIAWALAVLGPLGITPVLAAVRHDVQLSTDLFVYVAVVLLVAVTGGAGPAILASVISFLLANWFFTPPIHTFTIGNTEDVLALFVFLVLSAVVGGLVSASARRRAEVTRARAEAETLAALAGTLATGVDPLPTMVDQLRAAFGVEAVAVLSRVEDGWKVEAAAGEPVLARPSEGTMRVPLDEGSVLVVRGAGVGDEDLAVLRAFIGQLTLAVQQRRLRSEVGNVEALAESNELRTALLAAVSHDLRTPLASIKASVTSLLQQDVEWTPEATEELLETIDEGTDRLNHLVGNLLDMSRLQTGAVELVLRPVSLEEVVPAAVGGLVRCDLVDVNVPETLPPVRADAALLERTVANLIENAIAWSPPDRRVRVEAGAFANRVDLRVVDRGPGIPPEQRDKIFLPFQRLGDRSNGSGVGLGLAVARGFVEAMNGEITVEDTPGGGLTMVVSLPVAP